LFQIANLEEVMIDRKLYFARHGETTHAVENRFIGRTDSDLSPLGEEQILQLGKRMAEVPLAAIYSSPLVRCRKTANAVASHHKLDVQVVDELAEIALGDWEGLTAKEIEAKWPDLYKMRRDDMENFGAPGGETWGVVQKRAVAAFEKLLESAPDGPIFVAAHRGINSVFICHLMKLPLGQLFNFEQDYGCLNAVHFASGEARLELLNYTGQDAEENPMFEADE
jgi:probable phosphoglycerate mutase